MSQHIVIFFIIQKNKKTGEEHGNQLSTQKSADGQRWRGRNTLLGLDKEQKIRGANASSLLQKLCKGRYSHFFSGKAVAAYTGVEST